MVVLEEVSDEEEEFDPTQLSTEELRKEVERLRMMVENPGAVEMTIDPNDPSTWPPESELEKIGYGMPAGGVPSRMAAEPGGAPPGPNLDMLPPEVKELNMKADQTLKYKNGDTYKGDVLGGAYRQGKGIHTCAGGDYYDGDWNNDQRHGWGKMVFVRGLTYEGEWVKDKTEGYGQCTYEDGGTYTGEWRTDHRWGWGQMAMSNGDHYEGEWVDDIMEGKGKLTFQDGSYFEGEFKNNQKLKGKFATADGSVEYIGRWKAGMRSGFGTFHQAGAYKYMGEWDEDVRHGRGRCTWVGGAEYDGDWDRDRMHGQGKWSTHEEKYEGQFKDNQRCGQGACTYTNGDLYTGQWAGDARCGAGVMAYAAGQEYARYEGQWFDGKRDGKGTGWLSNGDKYQGEWKGGKRHGYGVCFFADGTKFRGEWEEDMWVQSAADPEFCRVLGPGIARGVAGEDAVFGIEARDEMKNKRLCGGDEFAVQLVGPAGVTVYGSVQDNDDGTYVCRYNATVAGRYELHVTLGDGEEVGESPYPVRVLPARAFARSCAVVGEGRRKAVRYQPAEFFIEVKDRFSNTLAGEVSGALPLQVTLSIGEVEVPVEIGEAGQGRLRVGYTALKAGFYRLDLRSGSVPLGDSPYSLQVKETPMLEAATDPVIENAAPVQDQLALWEQIAMTEFGADGDLSGWDDEPEEKETKEQKTMRENPDTPVLENYEDLYKLPKLQRMQKEKKEREQMEKLAKMRKKLEMEKAAAEAVMHHAHAAADDVAAPADSSIADLD